MKMLSDTEAELNNIVAYKKACSLRLFIVFSNKLILENNKIHINYFFMSQAVIKTKTSGV